MKSTSNNIAYVDGQNLHLGTMKRGPEWEVVLARFRVFLDERHGVKKAYYYLGYVQDGSSYQKLYDDVQDAGFHLIFREHNSVMKGTKKGNVDSDIIFSIMKRMYKHEDFNKIILFLVTVIISSWLIFLSRKISLRRFYFPNSDLLRLCIKQSHESILLTFQIQQL